MYKKRAFRRYQTWKKHQSAIQLVRDRWYGVDYTPEQIREGASRIRDNMKDCSCAMCCNPRHRIWASNHERLSIQERRNADKFNLWVLHETH